MARDTNLVALRTGLLLVSILSLVIVSGARAQNALRMLHEFERGAAGYFPASNLVFDKAGNLYGTTVQGGNLSGACGRYGCGVIFKLAPTRTAVGPRVCSMRSALGMTEPILTQV